MPPPTSNPARVLAASSLAVFLVPFMSSSMNLALPNVAGDLRMGAHALTFLVSSYLVGTCLFQMPAARAADILGRRRLFFIGLAVFAVFTLACALARSAPALILFRFAAGAGSAMVYATNMAILTSVFPKERRGWALGVNTAVVYLAISVGPLAGGVLATHFGWRAIFLACLLLTLAAVAAGLVSITDEWRPAEGEAFDWPGSAAFVIMVGGVVVGLSCLPDWKGWVLLAGGLAAGAGFVKLEERTAAPMLRLELFRENRQFRLTSLSALINYAASFAISFILSLYLHFILGLPADAAGAMLMVQPVTQMILSPIAGKLSDRMDPSWLTTGGMGLISCGLFAMAWLTAATPLWVTAMILAVVGVGFGLFASPNASLIMGSVSGRDAAAASATTGTARQIGQALSMAATSLIVNAYLGDRQLDGGEAGELLAAMRTGFLIFTVVGLAGTATSAAKLFSRGAAGKG